MRSSTKDLMNEKYRIIDLMKSYRESLDYCKYSRSSEDKKQVPLWEERIRELESRIDKIDLELKEEGYDW